MATVGEILRTEREKQGLTVKDVENATSIRALYISAIEDGKYSTVPGEVYLKGFIRNYANFLGLNGQEMVEIYRQSQNPQPTIPPEEIKPEANEGKHRDKPVERQTTNSSSKMLIGGLVTIAVAGGIWWYASTGNDIKPEAPKQVPPSPAPIQQNLASQPLQPTAPVPLPAVKAKPVVVAAKFTEECWAQIMVDGKEVFEGILKAGESKTWEAEQNIVVKLGNAGAADLTYNGKTIGKLGVKGEVVSKTFTPETKP